MVNHSRRRRAATLLVAITILAFTAAPASAQQKAPPKEPPIDLDELARQPRPGQPAPKPAPAEQKPVEAAPTPPPPTPASPQPSPPAAAKPQPAPPPKVEQADPLAALAAGITREPAKLAVTKVEGAEGQVESRRVWTGAATFMDRWRPVTKPADASLNIVEFRTGLSGAVTLKVDDNTTVAIGRMARARVGRMNTGDASASASRVVIELLRGKIDVSPAPGTSVNVVTPDGIVVVREAAIVAHDAAKGTTTTPTGQVSPAGK